MNKREQPRKNVPGGRDIVREIKNLSEEIVNIDNEIQSCQQKIKDIIAANKASSPLGALKERERSIMDEFDQLRRDKQNLLEDLRNYKATLDSLREECNSKGIRRPMNLEEIQRQMDELSLKLISSSVSPKEEKEIAETYAKLRIEKGKLNKIDTNKKSIEDIEALYSSTKASISSINEKIAEQKNLKDDVHADISKIEKSSREKSPEILRLESKITSLVAQKKSMIGEKIQKKESLRAIEEEYAKFEVHLNEQKDLEGRKDAIKKEIATLRTQKESILVDLHNIDPQLINSLLYSLKELKKRNETKISLNIVHSFVKLGVRIPAGASDMDKTIADLELKKTGFTSAYAAKKAEADSKIDAISNQIIEKMKELENLPATDYDVFKRDAFKPKLIKN